MSVLLILFWITVALWSIWFICFPIYKKIKKEKVLISHYMLGLDIGAVVAIILNIIMLIIDITH